MRFLLYASILIAWLGVPHAVAAQAAPPALQNPRLVRLIDSLYRSDQRPFEQAGRHELSPDSAVAQSHRIYRQNYGQLQRILRDHGYPGFALVGAEATSHFNTMVLHCFFDVAFQQRVLQLFTQESVKAPALLADKRYLHDLAYLTDKVKRNLGQPQVYGTQLDYNQQGPYLLPSIEPAQLDERRRQMQLEPSAVYLQKATAVWKQMNQKK